MKAFKFKTERAKKATTLLAVSAFTFSITTAEFLWQDSTSPSA